MTDRPLAPEHVATLRAHEDAEDWPDGPDDRFNPWCVSKDGTGFTVETDKPGDWKPWLQYLIDRFLTPWDYTLSGSVGWEGEEEGDAGIITIESGKVKARRKKPTVTWTEVDTRTRENIGEQMMQAMHSDYGRNRDAWLAAMEALGVAPTSDRTEFDD